MAKLLIPTDKVGLIQLLRDLADAIEKGETEYRGCQVTQSMDREIMADGQYGDISSMAFDLRVAASRTSYDLFKTFSQVQHRASRSVE